MWHLGTTLPPVIIGAFEGNDQIKKAANSSKCMWNKFLEAISYELLQKRKSFPWVLLTSCVDFSVWSDYISFFSLTLHGPFSVHLLWYKKKCLLKCMADTWGNLFIHANAAIIMMMIVIIFREWRSQFSPFTIYPE